MKQQCRLAKILILVFVVFFCLFSGENVFAERLLPSDLIYQGAFLLPTTDFFAATGERGYPQTSGMTFYPAGNGSAGSIYLIGRGGRVAEIAIPSPKMSSLSTATVLQSNMDPFNYSAALDNDATSGIAYMPPRGSQTSPKLYFGSFEYYNVDVSDYNSLGWANITLSNPQTAGLWHVGPTTSDSSSWSIGPKHGEYLFSVPQSWADTYMQGRSLFVGRMREGGNSGGSKGPVITAVAPWASGNPPAPGTALPATPLTSFGGVNWTSWRLNGDPDWTYFSGGDRVTGGAFVDRGGRRAVLLGMRHGTFDNCPVLPEYGSDGSHGGFCLPTSHPEYGTEPYCYGDGGTECPSGVSITNNKGYANGPYVARLAFIDISDLELVAQGQKSYSSVGGYAIYNLMNDFGRPSGTQQDRTGSNDVVGVAYDEARGLLYVGQSNGNDPDGHPNPAWPVIHVYQVSGTPDTTSPTSPTNLAANATSSSSISVTWTAATDNIGVTGYLVERCQGTGCTNFTQVGTPSTSPFVDTGLTANTFYNYHVKARDAAGNESGWSNVVGATTQAPDTQAPTVPTNLQATAASSNTINLTWTASTDNVAVTGYHVERCTGSGCTNFSQITSLLATNYQDTGLSASTLYRYRVRATDGAGNNSGYSTIAQATTPEAPPISQNLLLGLNFNEGTGTTTQDVSGRNHTGTLSNATWSAGRTGNGVSFSGSANSYVSIPNESDFDLTNNFTVSLWMKTASFGSVWASLISKGDSSWSLTRYNATSTLDFNTFSPSAHDLQGSANVANDTWHHIAIVYDGATKKLYVDGNVDAQTNFTQTLSTNNFPVRIGGNAEYTSGAFSGSVDDVRIYNKALTQTEIQTDMNTPLTQGGTGTFTPCNTVTTGNFSQAAYNSYGAPFDAFQTSTNLMNATCSSADPHTIQATIGQTGDTTRIVYTKGYYYAGSSWTQYSGTCTGALNGEWCQGSVSATITNPNISTADNQNPAYFVGMTCSVQGGGWKCGCRDTACTNFYWQIQGAGQ